MLAPNRDRARMQKLFAATTAARGACKVDRAEQSDGKVHAKMRLSCERYPILLDLTLQEQGEKVKELKLVPVAFRSARCAQ